MRGRPKFAKVPAVVHESWWLAQQTREDFIEAHRREIDRMTREGKSAPSEGRIVGSTWGKP